MLDFSILTEPVKQWLRNLRMTRGMRRHIYAKLSYNLKQLHDLFDLGEGAHKMGRTIDLNACAKNTFKTVRYDAAKDEAFLFYRLEEADWFDHMYVMFRKMETNDIRYEIRCPSSAVCSRTLWTISTRTTAERDSCGRSATGASKRSRRSGHATSGHTILCPRGSDGLCTKVTAIPCSAMPTPDLPV